MMATHDTDINDLPIEASSVEELIRKNFDNGDFDKASTIFIQHYGGEILGFIVGRVRNASMAGDIFSAFTEDFWRGLPGFKWRTSIKVWAYTLARNAFYRHLNAHRKHARDVPFSGNTSFQIESDKLRSATQKYLKTEVKSKMRELRERLPQDDQTLIILRIDQKLSWDDLAVILSGDGDEMEDTEKKRWSARLRKRFQFVKGRLKEMAKEEGLLDG